MGASMCVCVPMHVYMCRYLYMGMSTGMYMCALRQCRFPVPISL